MAANRAALFSKRNKQTVVKAATVSASDAIEKASAISYAALSSCRIPAGGGRERILGCGGRRPSGGVEEAAGVDFERAEQPLKEAVDRREAGGSQQRREVEGE
jgi:hypothetical protein